LKVEDDTAEVKEGEKKKTKTVTEKYWDWELANETKPIWVRYLYVMCAKGCFRLYLVPSYSESAFHIFFWLIVNSKFYFLVLF